ncbi:M91 family zinc metallopeptidase [Pseudomonas sp. SC11]|uniref:M91 family zinc metallopeptidase n=1 Tax=Pseudomonas sp. SC11 TaxID=326927 RepID=UPI003999F14F
MSPDEIRIEDPSGVSVVQNLPYRSGPLTITRQSRQLLIEVLDQGCNLIVRHCPEGLALLWRDVTCTLTLAAHDTVRVRTGDGDDQVIVESSLDRHTVIESGDGNDDIQVHGPAPDAQALDAGSVMVDAGGGDDRVVVQGLRQVEIDGGAGNDVLRSGAAYSLLYAGPGEDCLEVEAGKGTLEALHGSNRVSTGKQDDRIYGDPARIIAESGFSAPLLYPLQDAQLPPEYVAAFKIKGDAHYVDQVTRQLTMLRASPSASVLLDRLVAQQMTITIKPCEALDNAFASYDLNLGDPRMRDGVRGDRLRYCEVHYNPLAQRLDTPSLVMLYHELCHAWNYATGSVTDNVERLAVGLDNPGSMFDYDDDPTTPDTDTNPPPFNENALRFELGLPPRLSYP